MYLDTAILVKLVIKEPDSLFYADLVDDQTSVWSSQVALTECWSALCRKEQEGEIDSLTRRTAWDMVESHIRDGSLRLQPVIEPILRRANAIIEQCLPRVPVRTLDAIHLASCELSGAYPLMTNDRVMRKAAECLNIPLGPVRE
jgi:predicted nucleic acid-binding protein